VHPATLIKVSDEVPLTTLAPFGCGVITGAGAVLNALQVEAGSTVAVLGAGAVGLSAVMAAQLAGAGRIIAVDIKPGRLAIAAELGATDTVNAAEVDTAAAVRELTGGRGVDYSVESTGLTGVMRTAVAVLAPLGAAAILGSTSLDATFEIGAFELLKGRRIVGSVMGHQAPSVFVPRLVDLYRSGRFPVDRLIHTYPLTEINDAVADVADGRTVKAVLTHDHS
jgi:aryl-alcohol dehydrogenase